MTGAAPEHEAVPHRMMVPQPVPEIEYDAEGVAKSPRQQQPEPAVGHIGQHGLDRHDDQPSDEEIGERRGQPVTRAKEELEHGTRATEPPDYAKQGPAPWTAQSREQERR